MMHPFANSFGHVVIVPANGTDVCIWVETLAIHPIKAKSTPAGVARGESREIAHST